MKGNIFKKIVSMLCVVGMTLPFVSNSAMAIKGKKGVTQYGSKKISELNEVFAKYLEKLKKFKDEIKQLNKSYNPRSEYFLNYATKEIDKSINIIEMLDCILIDDSIVKVELQDDLNVLLSKVRVLGHFLKRCRLNSERKDIEFIDAKEIKEQGQDELLPDEISKLNKDVENSSVMNVLLQTAIQVRDELNNVKNKINMAADNDDKQVTNGVNESDVNDKNSRNKEIFISIDKLYNNAAEKAEDKTIQIIDIIKKAFPKEDSYRTRAMVAFDILNKYKDKKINREEIIKQLVEPVVRKEIEISCNRCFDEGGPLLKKTIEAAQIKESIDLSIKLAINSEANSLYEFCCVVFYGTDVDSGLYDLFNDAKMYWYDQFDRSKDFILCPVIIDIVELNSLVCRLEELEYIGIDANNIRKISKVFDKIINDADNENGYYVGMYRHLVNKRYGEKECDEEYKELCVGDDTLLNELMNNFYNFINDIPFNSNVESKADIERKTHECIEKIRSSIQKIDEKYSKTSEGNPEFSTISQKEEFKKKRMELYEQLFNFELCKFGMNWNRLSFKLETEVMDNFRKNKVEFKERRLTIDEFMTLFDRDKKKCLKDILHVDRFKDRYRYLNELADFLDYIDGEPVLLLKNNGIISSIINDDYQKMLQYGCDATDQEIIEMKEIADRDIVDMRNIKANSFILEHQIKYATFIDRFAQSSWDSYIYSGEGDPIKLANEFKKYYEENRYDLSQEKIEHLEKLADEFNTLLLRFLI